MKYLLLTVLLLIAGCVSIPIPPYGVDKGQLGTVTLQVNVAYTPTSKVERECTDSMRYAWGKFGETQPKLLKDK
jgi:hypothetical protein